MWLHLWKTQIGGCGLSVFTQPKIFPESWWKSKFELWWKSHFPRSTLFFIAGWQVLPRCVIIVCKEWYFISPFISTAQRGVASSPPAALQLGGKNDGSRTAKLDALRYCDWWQLLDVACFHCVESCATWEKTRQKVWQRMNKFYTKDFWRKALINARNAATAAAIASYLTIHSTIGFDLSSVEHALTVIGTASVSAALASVATSIEGKKDNDNDQN